jgi:methyl-accepting chemotaxis protein
VVFVLTQGSTLEIHGAFEIKSSLEATNREITKAKITVTIWTLAILSVISLTVWLLLDRNIIRPLRNATTYIKEIAEGKLTAKLAVNNKDEFGNISYNLNIMADGLNQMIREIITASESLLGSSDVLGKTAESLVQGSKETSERSVSVSAAAEEMSSNMTSVAAATEEAATNIKVDP